MSVTHCDVTVTVTVQKCCPWVFMFLGRESDCSCYVSYLIVFKTVFLFSQKCHFEPLSSHASCISISLTLNASNSRTRLVQTFDMLVIVYITILTFF